MLAVFPLSGLLEPGSVSECAHRVVFGKVNPRLSRGVLSSEFWERRKVLPNMIVYTALLAAWVLDASGLWQ